MTFQAFDSGQQSFPDVDDNSFRPLNSSLINPVMLDPNYMQLGLVGSNSNGSGHPANNSQNMPANQEIDMSMLQQLFQQIQPNFLSPDFLNPDLLALLSSSLNSQDPSSGGNSAPFDINFDPSLLSSQNTSTDLNTSSASYNKPKRPKVDSSVLRCTCHNTNCLKRYCVCFKAGRLCTKDCACGSCKNCPGNEEEVREAIEKAKDAHPNAFMQKSEANRPGCKCKRECRKNYCECRRNNFSCFQQCNCVNCQNGKPNMGMGLNLGLMNMSLFQLENMPTFSATISNILAQQQAQNNQNSHNHPILELPEDAEENRRNSKRFREEDGEDEEFDTHINEANLTLRRPSTRKRRTQKLNDDYYVDQNVAVPTHIADSIELQEQNEAAEPQMTQMIPQMVRQSNQDRSHYDPAQDNEFHNSQTDEVYNNSNGQYKNPEHSSTQAASKALAERE